ncbi:zinc-binding dehydrogenase [Nonomuraea sp. NPDC049480]|uniref:zinc-binding dehydrogenase n=1 Tax=Nonomuraea sp. NPDC049480 TaxID=3364353 RepID=UPI0037942B1F
MRALIYDPAAAHRLRLGEAEDPAPAPGQALIQVTAVSFNFGEIAFRPADGKPGHVSGWDAAGVVVQAAADGSGPAAGTRVATFGWSGAWAESRAVDTGNLAVVPDDVDLGRAAALPVAGATALQALRRLGPVIGRRVLITGASGGVGRYAVQLAARAGAHVIASVGGPSRVGGLRELGAAEIVFGPSAVSGRVYGVLDNVGGSQLAQAYNLLEDGGTVQAVGMASREPTLIDFEEARTRVDRGRLETFNLSAPLGDDLTYLVDLLRKGELDPQIGWRGPWERAREAAEALLARRVAGKVVLDL